MRRKGWDLLSDAYRNRLTRSGITEQSYSSGAALHAGRGHTSKTQEQYLKEVRVFAKQEMTRKTSRTGKRTTPERTESSIRQHLKSLGAQEGRDHMRMTRQMTRLYETGETERAHRMWLRRDKRLPDYMFWYHGVFG